MDRLSLLFAGERGKKIFDTAARTLRDNGMADKLEKGTLLGLSGGADSVMLLCFLIEYARRYTPFKIVCVHVNHMIRGAEADRDAGFSQLLAQSFGVEFIERDIDIPAIAKAKSMGLEECARAERYSAFSDIISGRDDISTIAVAHNATDNLETMIFNIFRGSGLKGACGIMPVRDNIVRPLIEVPKCDISAALDEAGIGYVYDSTNACTDYTRNFIRAEILPKFKRLTPDPEGAASKFCSAVREGRELIETLAATFLDENLRDGRVPTEKLVTLDGAVLSEVIILLVKNSSGRCERTHVEAVRELLGSSFSYSLPCGLEFVSSCGQAYVVKKDSCSDFYKTLEYGINEIDGIDGAIILSREKLNNSFSNVYKISIQRKFDFDIINGSLVVRSKLDGDTYRCGGVTHKLKKMFTDAKIPKEERTLVPLICDDSGILWPIGFSPRQDACDVKSDNVIYIALAYKTVSADNKKFYFKQNINQ